MIIFAAAIALLWGLAFVFLWRVPVCERSDTPHDYPALSVIVPARNEAHNLPRLLESLAGQDPPPAEIIVVDDGSTDGTADLARAAGARVIAAKPLPEGWRGKTWACMQGAEAAAGDILLFVDADTFFEGGGLRRIRDAFAERGGALSLGAYHRVERPYEELSAFFNILMTAGTGAFTIAGPRIPPAGLFGPFLMVGRETYFACGGHAVVKDKILENFHFAQVFRARGVPTACLGGKGSFSMRMYPDGMASLIEGWSKAFASGAASTPVWIVLATVGWLTGAILAVVYLLMAALMGERALLLTGCAVYLLYAAQLAVILRRLGAFRIATAALYPIPLAFYQVVFGRSSLSMLLGKKVSWKGREIDADSGKRP